MLHGRGALLALRRYEAYVNRRPTRNWRSRFVPSHITLVHQDFIREAELLQGKVDEFEADLVVGIAKGGDVLARVMLEFARHRPTYVSVKVQRRGTKVKARLPSLGALPGPLRFILRWVEVEYREFAYRMRRMSGRSWETTELTTGAIADLQSQLHEVASLIPSRILIVDDTIDSGFTIALTEQAVRQAFPSAQIRSAVLASTWRHPPIQSFYCTYHRMMIRFPWSQDVAGRSSIL